MVQVLYDFTGTMNDYTLFNNGWVTDRSNLANLNSSGEVFFNGSTYATQSSYSAVLWREIAPYPVTVTKVAWFAVHGPVVLPTNWIIKNLCSLTNTRDYVTDDNNVTAGTDSSSLYASPFHFSVLEYDGAQEDSGTYDSSGIGKRHFLMWYEAGEWKFGQSSSALSGLSDLLNTANYTLRCSAVLPLNTYKYLNFRAQVNHIPASSYSTVWWDNIALEYTAADPPDLGSATNYHTPTAQLLGHKSESSRFAPPRTR